MKKIFFTLAASLCLVTSYAQSSGEFSDKINLDCLEVQDQGYSGTCWCFSSMSFLETEMMKNGIKNVPNLSEMYVVRYNYLDRAKKYVMLHGNMTFSQGSYFWDNIAVMRDYGLVPEEAYPNTKTEGMGINHSDMEQELKRYIDSVADESNKFIDTAWVDGYNALLDKYLGKVPESFSFDGKTYTPESFAKNYCGLNPEDYIQVTSFSHHGFNTFFPLELPDNWRWSMFLNVKIDDLITVIDNSLAQGHTVLWASDVSEDGFNYYKGVAVLTEDGVTQESRQKDFINRKTTDDHGMQIVGTAVDKNGGKFYKVKNSWGKGNAYRGYLYVSEDFVKAKTTGLLVNKECCKEFLETAKTEFK